MFHGMSCKTGWIMAGVLAGVLSLTACANRSAEGDLSAADIPPVNTPGPDYLIGPGDNLNIFVWRNPELTLSVPVRPERRPRDAPLCPAGAWYPESQRSGIQDRGSPAGPAACDR